MGASASRQAPRPSSHPMRRTLTLRSSKTRRREKLQRRLAAPQPSFPQLPAPMISSTLDGAVANEGGQVADALQREGEQGSDGMPPSAALIVMLYTAHGIREIPVF